MIGNYFIYIRKLLDLKEQLVVCS